ncbi:hypothetical protein CF326_g4619 [Tilletia indica]|nr:hypothetical protein CF326_g4619 [Tilletia indica]
MIFPSDSEDDFPTRSQSRNTSSFAANQIELNSAAALASLSNPRNSAPPMTLSQAVATISSLASDPCSLTPSGSVASVPTPSQAVSITPSFANDSSSSAPVPTSSQAVAITPSVANDSSSSAPSGSTASVPTSPQAVAITPSLANDSSNSAPSGSIASAPQWPLKDALSGTQAHFYRGPLPPAKVLSLLQSNISKNGRLSLMGNRAGYLVYFHFLGPSNVPTARKRPAPPRALAEQQSKPRDSRTKRPREAWRCRLCNDELHVPHDQISNLGAHLYGPSNRPQRGCMEARAHSPAETIPPPRRDATGQIIRLQANKSEMRQQKTT